MHRRNRRDPPLRDRGGHPRARVAVAPRAEGGPRDEERRLLGRDQPEQPLERLVLVLAEEVVAARHGRCDLDAFELRRETAPRPHRALEPQRLRRSGLLAAEAREELVQVVDGLHHAIAWSVSWPIWFVAPR